MVLLLVGLDVMAHSFSNHFISISLERLIGALQETLLYGSYSLHCGVSPNFGVSSQNTENAKARVWFSLKI